MIDKNIEFEQFVNGILDLSGEIALNNFRKIRDLTLKGDFSPVTKADEDIEQFIRDKIFEKYPNHKIIGEELDDFKGSENITWYIDPIDGTNNFVHNYPSFAVSIGVYLRSKPIAGVVYDIPNNEKFFALKDGGSFSNDSKISVSNKDRFSEGLYVTGFIPYDENYIDKNLLYLPSLKIKHTIGKIA